MLLWKSVVKNPLLAKTNLVLFLNKCDVLRAKLNAGIRLGKYVISYGDRPNDFEHASDCEFVTFFFFFLSFRPSFPFPPFTTVMRIFRFCNYSPSYRLD